jgi:hypothetical protein
MYRATLATLQQHYQSPEPEQIEFYLDELKETLLVKQAVIGDDARSGRRAMEEIRLLLTELDDETSD